MLQLYTRAIELNVDFPSFWHRNLALVCHQLAYLSHDQNDGELLEKSIKHFSIYLEKEPVNDDGAKIQKSIEGMKRQLKIMSKMN